MRSASLATGLVVYRSLQPENTISGTGYSYSYSYHCLSDRLHKVKAIAHRGNGTAALLLCKFPLCRTWTTHATKSLRRLLVKARPLRSLSRPLLAPLPPPQVRRQLSTEGSRKPLFSSMEAERQEASREEREHPLCRNERALAFCLRFLLAPVNRHANGWVAHCL
ncbi:hypothetical protein BDP81DRAFT_69579 [Colletotrichum phormii]|uniref:Uncharacterized protein n=1 Tax=Colletotrichum phormii TaxID=359342 RepID=A0AAJ0EC60_9PEZI|nr:uncharacterized protein BDP81DRAFT_69579 [Colletotrichum phormii]KAK1633669.1 hypothetical protein BDP81DRAFT_69579 [Colletotrichum phormii]